MAFVGDDLRWKSTNTLYVKQDAGTNEYTSVAAALAAVTGPSASNPWVIYVAPGIYTEPQLVLPSYVHIKGFEASSTIIQPSSLTTAFVVMSGGSSISRCTVRGASGVGGIGIQVANTGLTRVDVSDCTLTGCETLVDIASTGTPTITTVRNCVLQPTFTTGVNILSTGGVVQCLVNGGLYNNPAGVAATTVFKVSGTGASLLCSDSLAIQVGGVGIQVSDGARAFVQAFSAASLAKAIYTPNTGAAPTVNIQSFIGRLNTMDLDIAHTGTIGSASGAFVTSTSTVASSAFAVFSADPSNGIVFTGDVSFGPTFAQKTPYTQLLIQSPTMGALNGGGLSSGGGTTVNVAAGYGYYESGGAVVYKSWNATSIVLGAAVDHYIYFDNTGTLTSSASFPDTAENIVLGRAITRGSAILVITPTPQLARHTSNKLGATLRRGLGAVLSGGMIVSENTTPLHLDISAGDYYIGVSNYLPVASTNFSFTTFRSDGLGDWTVTPGVNTIPVTQYDGGAGSLVTMTNNRWAKHTIYAFGDATTGQAYYMVYAQAEYTSQAAAEAAPLPNPPSFLRESIIPVAAIVFQKSTASIAANGQIIDIRPRIGTTATTIAAADHGNLSGLADDDHTQYVRTDGTRLMTGPVLLTEQSTPSTPASGTGAAFAGTDGKFKYINDDGVVKSLGDGAGELNLVTSPNDAVGWTTAGGFAVATTSTAGDLPLSSLVTTAIKITSDTSAGTEATEYVQFTVTTPASLTGKQKVEFYQRPGTNFINGEWTVSVYQSSTRQALSTDVSGVTRIPNLNGKFTTYVDVLPSTSYSVRFARTVNAGANAGVLNVANVIFGPGIQASTAAVGPVSPTVTFNNATNMTITNGLTFFRLGEYLLIGGYFQVTAGDGSNAGSFSISLSGITVTASQSGNVRVEEFTTNYAKTFLAYASGGGLTFYTQNNGSVASVNLTGTLMGANTSGKYKTFYVNGVVVKVDEWAGSGVNIGQNDVSFVADDGSADVFGPNGALVPNVAASVGTTQRSFTPPGGKSDADMYVLEYNFQGNGWTNASGLFPFLSGNNGVSNNYYGIQGYWSSSTVYSVNFGNQGVAISTSGASAGSSSWASEFGAGSRFRLRKATGGQAVGFGIVSENASGLMPSTNVNLDNASATRLGYKTYSHGGSYNGATAPTITLAGGGGSLSSVSQGDFVPYQTQEGNWRCKFNVTVQVTSTSRTNLTLSVNGITFYNNGGDGQAVSGGPVASTATGYHYVQSNAAFILSSHNTVTTSEYWYSGDVRLASKPSWAY